MKKQRITFWNIDTCKSLAEELRALTENGITIDNVIPTEYYYKTANVNDDDLSSLIIVNAIIIVSHDL